MNVSFGSLWHHFGFTLGALAACGGDFGGTLGSLWRQVWVSFGSVWVSVGDFGSLDGHFAMIVEPLGILKMHFQKTFIFPTDFNDFIKL